MKKVVEPLFKWTTTERDGIFEFVSDFTLDESKRRERDANYVSDEVVLAEASKPVWGGFSRYNIHFQKRKSNLLMHYLASIDTSEIAFLGCDWGTEIVLALESGLTPELIYVSNLVYSSVKAAALRLKQRNKNCVCFTSDLDNVPLARRDIPNCHQPSPTSYSRNARTAGTNDGIRL